MSGDLDVHCSPSFDRFTGSTILKLTFGYTAATDGKDPLVVMGGRASSTFVTAVNNLWVVDIFPFREFVKISCAVDRFDGQV